ncbi:MAG: hypothetical protein M0R06_03945 [Sphaerochaeta sp.]|jgi:hypothetical protein|nr:hypothetical protein [Sphaerochaeta sp.]
MKDEFEKWLDDEIGNDVYTKQYHTHLMRVRAKYRTLASAVPVEEPKAPAGLVEVVKRLIMHPKTKNKNGALDPISAAYLGGQKSVYDMFYDELTEALSRYEAEEPLACLADGLKWVIIRQTRGKHQWEIELKNFHIRDGYRLFCAPTYSECEAKARAFLAGLPDRPTKEQGKEER